MDLPHTALFGYETLPTSWNHAEIENTVIIQKKYTNF